MSGGPSEDPVIHVVPARRVTAGLEDRIVELFVASYEDADPDYLRASLERLGSVALAFEGARLIGFGLGDRRRTDLPRLPDQDVHLAGLICVAADHRRRGLMGALGSRAIASDAAPTGGLLCGRVAHPASLRGMTRMPGQVPVLGRPPSVWHRAVGQAIADVYGATSFDPETFVCRGRGRPIGSPRLIVDATPDEWALFAHVDRARGDSLLAFAWMGPAPAGW